MNEQWKLYVMGSRGSWPICGERCLEFGGATSCYLLKRGDHAVVIDCGSGLTEAAKILKECRRIDILLTHLHYDHMIGILDWGVIPKEARVRIFADFDNWFGRRATMERFISPPFWPYTPDMGERICVRAPGSAELGDELTVHFHPSCHPDHANVLRLDGPDWSLCVAFDFEHSDPFPEEVARGCSMMLYDAMYTLEEYPQHVGWGHSCWEVGVEIARNLGVEQLVITHHDPNKDDVTLRAMERKAKTVDPQIRFARTGDVWLMGPKPVLQPADVMLSRDEVVRRLSRYMDSAILRQILSREEEETAVEMEECVLLFADIRGFTHFAQQIPPERLTAILNDFIAISTGCVSAQGGIIDKFMGDCIMAYWRVKEKPDALYAACCAALEMQRQAEAFSQRVLEETGCRVGIGIGIHGGPALVTHVGNSDFMAYTVIGSTVNTACRLEEYAAPGVINISEASAATMEDRLITETIEQQQRRRGRDIAVGMRRLLGVK